MLRSVDRSRFQVAEADAGEPRPAYRRLIFLNPFSLVAAPVDSRPAPYQLDGGRMIARAVQGLAVPREVELQDVFSLRATQEDERWKAARKWVLLLEPVRAESDALKPFLTLQGDDLCFLFLDREASTLNKHLAGWQGWLGFARGVGISPGNPSPAQIIEFATALSYGAIADRGAQRWMRARSVMHALAFIANKLGLKQLLEGLQNPVIVASRAGSKWNSQVVKEALPLSLQILAPLERAVLACSPDDQ